jgi:hypothetical protein
MKRETLIPVPESADGFRSTIGGLRSLLEEKGVSFHTFSLPDDRCVGLLLKNLFKRMPEAEMKEELEALHVSVQAVMQLRSKRWDQDPEKDREDGIKMDLEEIGWGVWSGFTWLRIGTVGGLL